MTAVMVLMQAASAPAGLLAFAQWRLLEITTCMLCATFVAAGAASSWHRAPAPEPPAALDRLTLAGGLLPVLERLAGISLGVALILVVAVLVAPPPRRAVPA